MMDTILPSISYKIKLFIQKQIKLKVKTICDDLLLDYDKCNYFIQSHINLLDKPILQLVHYKLPNQSFYIDESNRVYIKLDNNYKLVGLYIEDKKEIIIFT